MAKKLNLYQRPDGLYEKGLTIDGKRVRFRGKTEKEVLQKIASYQVKIQNGELFTPVAEEWRCDYETQVEYYTFEKTKAPYERAVEYFADFYIKDITPQDVNNFYLSLVSKGYAKKTVKNQRTVLSNIFKYAIVAGYTKENPTSFVDLPKNLKQNRRELPSDTDIQKVKNCVGCTFGLLPMFLMYTGCRPGEALALQYKDIDRVNKKIKITKAVYYEGNRPKIKQPKTESGIRDIPLLDKLAPHIPKGKPEEYIFSPNGTEPYDQSAFRRMWYRYSKESGVTATPYQLRHAYATMLYEAGIDEKLAQELMGHADISTTKNIYTHIRLSRLNDAADKLNNFDF